MYSRMKTFSTLFSALLLIASSFSVMAQQVAVSDGHVREVIPGNTVTSAYMTISNTGKSGLKLVGAKSDTIPRIEIHEHIMADGMMKMRQKSHIDIAAGDNVVLQPMGLHLMLFGLSSPVKAGQSQDITLIFEGGFEYKVTLPVHSIKKAKKHHHHH